MSTATHLQHTCDTPATCRLKAPQATCDATDHNRPQQTASDCNTACRQWTLQHTCNTYVTHLQYADVKHHRRRETCCVFVDGWALQHVCNTPATHLQHTCNTPATHLQHAAPLATWDMLCHLMTESYPTYEWVMSHIWISHVTHIHMSCHLYDWVTSHIYEWVMSQICMIHVTRMNASCHTYEWVMSHIWMSHRTHVN